MSDVACAASSATNRTQRQQPHRGEQNRRRLGDFGDRPRTAVASVRWADRLPVAAPIIFVEEAGIRSIPVNKGPNTTARRCADMDLPVTWLKVAWPEAEV